MGGDSSTRSTPPIAYPNGGTPTPTPKRPFQPGRTLEGTPARTLGEAALSLVDAEEQARGHRQRARTPKHHETFGRLVSAVVADLLHLQLHAQHSALTMTLDNTRLAGRSRYRSAVLSKQLPEVLNFMHAAGLAIVSKGWRSAIKRRPTTVCPGLGLLDLISIHQPALDDIACADPPELIVMKEPKVRLAGSRGAVAKWAEYADDDHTRALRAEMVELNAWLKAADLAVDPWPANSLPQPIDTRARSLVRYYANSRWDHGGRLFGGWWLNMKPETRGAMRIDGERVQVVDFNALFPRLAYARCGHDVPPDEDLYDVAGFPERYRKGVKKVTAALLFRTGRLTALPHATVKLLPKGTKAADIERAIRTRHPKIEDRMFGHMTGFELFHQESNILMTALADCRRAGLVALPLHDAIIAQESRSEEARSILEASYRRWTDGMTPAVTIKSPGDELDSLELGKELGL
jgi:hypothetical protein